MGTMKIGITYSAHASIFGSGRGQVAMTLYDVFTKIGHDVVLVCCSEEKTWWDDCDTLRHRYCIRQYAQCSGLDLLVDIDGAVSQTLRAQIATRCVVLLRKHLLFSELESATFIQFNTVRFVDGASAVWVWDVFNDESEFDSIRVLFPCPVYCVPFLWTSTVLRAYKEACGRIKDYPEFTDNNWTIRIAEKNTENTSSAVFPIVATYQMKRDNVLKFTEYHIHNSQTIKDNKFFLENIIENIKIEDVKIHFDGRERYSDWVDDVNPVVISHTRFIQFRPGLLDLAWLGIPFVHNSVFLRDLVGAGLDSMYYTNSSISELCQKLKVFASDTTIWSNFNDERRKIIEKRWSIEMGIDKWSNILNSISEPKCVPAVRQMVLPVTQPTQPTPAIKPITRQVVKFGFSDMWQGFSYSDNFFLDMMGHYYPTIDFIGVDGGTDRDIAMLIFGPFGDVWKSVNDIVPKVFFSGENIAGPQTGGISLHLSFSQTEDQTHIRFPLWLLFVNWFSDNRAIGDNTLTKNPNGLPHFLTTTSHTTSYKDRKEFCAFVVSNPCNALRNDVFTVLNKYKGVNSGGMLFNNIGGTISSKYPGGGSGDVSKFRFLEDHRFVLCFENSKGDGYVTEKLLHAKMAGCIPLYWGDKDADNDFNPEGFVNLSDMSEPSQIIDVVTALMQDPDRCAKLASVPALDDTRLNWAKKTIESVAHRLFDIASTRVASSICLHKQYHKQCHGTPKSLVFVSFATELFIESLLLNLSAIDSHKKIHPGIRYIIFTGDDVRESAISSIIEKYPWVTMRKLPTTVPEGAFQGFWDTKHFGWKLWILANVCTDREFKDAAIIYCDSGTQWLRLPHDYIIKSWQEGVCVMYDSENINRHWCSEKMIEEMLVTDAELSSPQILAGVIAFRGGHPLAETLFSTALQWGIKRDVLCGRRLIGILSSGQNYGHRHDQSILSILCQRLHIPHVIGNDYICEKSVRRTFLTNKCIYLHRGEYATHILFSKGIDDAWMVSLNRRSDRLESWRREYPKICADVNHFSAIDGKTLKLSDDLFNMFADNDFIWKKNVMGCALSHMILWLQLLLEKSPVNSYLIMEDDVRFINKEWRDDWEARLCEKVPADAELLYLGGVLPGNKTVYKECLDPVNDCWAKIKPNTLFSRGCPVPIFHFCTYSYIITKKGAEKLINTINTNGCFTSIDHFLGHPAIGLNKYALIDPIAVCFQENDPVYLKSEFNNFKRIDTFDSDIWNNVDVFNTSGFVVKEKRDFHNIIKDVIPFHSKNTITAKLIGVPIVSEQPARGSVIYYYDDSETCGGEFVHKREIEWLQKLWPVCIVLKNIRDVPVPEYEIMNNPWIVVNHPHIEYWCKIMDKWVEKNKTFSVIHYGDKYGRDVIDFYNYSQCKYIVRNYIRSDTVNNTKVITIPLGYLLPMTKEYICNFKDRDIVWTFHGANWNNRVRQLDNLKQFTPYDLLITDPISEPKMSSESEYCDKMRSRFCPTLCGNNHETHRIYKALEMGCIPLYVRSAEDAVFWKWISDHLGIIELKSWDIACKLVDFFQKNEEHAEKYRCGIIEKWNQWKTEIKAQLSDRIGL